MSRLFQCTFSTNPHNKPWVIHTNGDKFDFSLDNLRGATHKESIAKNKPPYPEKTSKVGSRPVIRWSVTKDKEKGEKMNTFPSAKAAQEALRNDGKPKADRTAITLSCKAALKDKMLVARYGYYWSYVAGERTKKTKNPTSPTTWSRSLCSSVTMSLAMRRCPWTGSCTFLRLFLLLCFGRLKYY